MRTYLGYSMYVLFALNYYVTSTAVLTLIIHTQQRRDCIMFERRSLLPAGMNDRYYVFHRSDNGRALSHAPYLVVVSWSDAVADIIELEVGEIILRTIGK